MNRRLFFRDRLFLLFVFFTASLYSLSGEALAQLKIEVNNTLDLNVGILIQAQADWRENPADDTHSQNLFLRRARFILGGRITPSLSFFYETDGSGLGKATTDATAADPNNKMISDGLRTLDAVVTWKRSDPLIFDVGLMIVPFCRNCLENTATLLPIDSGAYTFSNSAATQSIVGRDAGAQLRGYLVGSRLEYRAGLFQGDRSRVNNPLRFAGRIQYNVLDPEVGFVYTGTSLGTKKVLAFGAGIDLQKDYRAYAGDVILDHPWGPGAVTIQIDYLIFDGGTFLPALPEQRDWLAEAGYYFFDAKVTPWLKAEERTVSGESGLNERRYQAGLTYYVAAHRLNLKAGYGKVNPKVGKSADLFTLQLQAYSF